MSSTTTPTIDVTTIPQSTFRPTIPAPRRLHRGVMAAALAAGMAASVTVGALLTDGDDTTGRARLSSVDDADRDASPSLRATSVDASTFDPSALAPPPAPAIDVNTFDPSVLAPPQAPTVGANTFDPSVLAPPSAPTVNANTFDPSILGTAIPTAGGAHHPEEVVSHPDPMVRSAVVTAS